MLRPTPEFSQSYYLYKTQDSSGTLYQTYFPYYTFFREYSGVQTPDYKAKKAHRDLMPMNPYYSNVVWKQNKGNVSYTTQGQPTPNKLWTASIRFASRDPLDGWLPSLVPESSNKVTRKLYKAVDGVKVNLAQFLAERKQVADLLASTATRVYQAARALKRADLRSFANALSLSGTETRDLKRTFERVYKTPPLERIPNHWLEFVYGWRPLLSDCFEAAELLGEQLNTYEGPEGVLRVRSTTRRQFLVGDYDYSTLTEGNILADYVDRHDCVSRIVTQYRLDDEARSLLNKTGISNPALLAWELLPYSFVVDWFVPVGTYLESLTAMDGFTLVRGTISTLEAAVSTRTLRAVNVTNGAGAFQESLITGGVEAQQRRYTRSSSTSFPYALRVRSPIGDRPLERFVTAASLIPGLFKRADTSITVRRNLAGGSRL